MFAIVAVTSGCGVECTFLPCEEVPTDDDTDDDECVEDGDCRRGDICDDGVCVDGGAAEGEGEPEPRANELIAGCEVTSLDLTSCGFVDRKLLQADCNNGDRYEVFYDVDFDEFDCLRNGVQTLSFDNDTLCDLNENDSVDRRQILIRMREGCQLE